MNIPSIIVAFALLSFSHSTAYGILTTHQKNFYEQNGFLVIPDFFTDGDCDALKEHVADLVTDFDAYSIRSTFDGSAVGSADMYFLESGDKIRFFFEKDAFSSDGLLQYPKELCINKIGHAMHDLDPEFDRFSRHPKLAALTDDLGVSNPLLIQSMYIFKQPFIGGEVCCHQDSTYLISEPDTAIGYWVAIEDATVDNGCLWVIPGLHKEPLKSLCVREGNVSEIVVFDDTPWDETLLIPLEVKKGTLIVLHGLLPHKSLQNFSAKSRHAFTLHVIDGSSTFSSFNWLRRPDDFPFRGFN